MPPEDTAPPPTLAERLWELRRLALLVVPFVVLYAVSGTWPLWPLLVLLPLLGVAGYGLVLVGRFVLRQLAEAFTGAPPRRG
jgi:hypothetical protein